MITVYEKIRQLRQAKGWTQEFMANKLDMPLNSYGAIERGETNVSIARLEKISSALELDLSDLFCLDFKNTQLQHQIDMQKMVIEKQNKEIELLKEIIAIMKSQ